ncbi:MAG: hypothetical protein AAFV53_28930 [Myxococcota bacterium]
MRTLCIIYSILFGLFLMDNSTPSASPLELALIDGDPHTPDMVP